MCIRKLFLMFPKAREFRVGEVISGERQTSGQIRLISRTMEQKMRLGSSSGFSPRRFPPWNVRSQGEAAPGMSLRRHQLNKS
jgi:hypothetical protein